MYKSIICSLLAIMMIFTNQNYACAGKNDDLKDFKIIGYYSGDLFDEPIENLQLDKLTHIMYAFLIPKKDGTIVPIEKSDKLKELVSKSHENNVKVCIAVGGWSYKNVELAPVFEQLASNDATLDKFVQNIVGFVDEYNLDGVEIDWEYPTAGQNAKNYEKLVLALNKELSKKDKLLTAALNGAWSKTQGPVVSQLVTDNCLKSFDFINVMSYDINNDNHAPVWHFNTSIDYWINRGVERKNIIVGVPLYARPSWKQYRHLVDESKENAYTDFAKGNPDSYYNGLVTIKEKTNIAYTKAGGIMLFDVNEDTNDETSIVTNIYETVKKLNAKDMSVDTSNKIRLIIDNNEIVFNEIDNLGMPFIDGNNRMLIPVRKPLESIGVSVKYDDKNRVVIATKDALKVKIPVDKNYLYANGIKIKMDTQSIMKHNRVYIPTRYVFETFGYEVSYDELNKSVIVSKRV